MTSPIDRPPLAFETDLDPLPPPDSFGAACAEFGLDLEPGEVERLGRFLAALLRANEKVNLTAIRDPDEAWHRHIFDSLTLIPLIAELPVGARIADVGSGGGLPAIPLAVAIPAVRFTLIEATAKKAAFLRAAAQGLELENIEVLCDRAEAMGQDHRLHRSKYDAVTARAVGPLAVIAELAVPLAKIGGLVLLTKGERADQELIDAKQALHKLHASHAGTVETPTGRIVVIEKQRETPREYPRRAGEAKRSPLK